MPHLVSADAKIFRYLKQAGNFQTSLTSTQHVHKNVNRPKPASLLCYSWFAMASLKLNNRSISYDVIKSSVMSYKLGATGPNFEILKEKVFFTT